MELFVPILKQNCVGCLFKSCNAVLLLTNVLLTKNNNKNKHQAIFFHLSRLMSWWQQTKQGIPDVPHFSNASDLLLGHPAICVMFLIHAMSSWGFLFVGHVWKTFKERRPGCFLNRCRNELLNPFLNLYLRQTPATLRMKLILVNPSFHFLNLPEVTLGRYIHWYIKIFAFQLSSLISTILQYNTRITLWPPQPPRPKTRILFQ